MLLLLLSPVLECAVERIGRPRSTPLAVPSITIHHQGVGRRTNQVRVSRTYDWFRRGMVRLHFFLCFSREEWDECNLRDVCWVAIGELLKNTTDADLPFVQLMLTHTLTMLNSSIEKPVCA
jgi:hypothetical protein